MLIWYQGYKLTWEFRQIDWTKHIVCKHIDEVTLILMFISANYECRGVTLIRKDTLCTFPLNDQVVGSQCVYDLFMIYNESIYTNMPVQDVIYTVLAIQCMHIVVRIYLMIAHYLTVGAVCLGYMTVR